MFDVSVENSFDFQSAEYAGLFDASAATPFQSPAWLSALYGKLLVHNAATPLIIVVRKSADKELAMVLPLVRRRYSALRVVEFADLRVSDYVSPVAGAETFARILADENCVTAVRRLAKPYDLLRIGKLSQNALQLEKLFGVQQRESMGMNAYATRLGQDFVKWRERQLPRSYRKELDKKSRQLHRRGELHFECSLDPEAIGKTFEALKIYRGLRFENKDGVGDLLQVPSYYDFYLGVAVDGRDDVARTYTMWLDGRVIAGALGLAHHGSFLVILGGFDHDNFKNQSIGSLMFEAIARDCIERGERCLDFTIGDEPYKLTFGGEPSPMWRISRPGSPIGYAASLLVEKMPAAKTIARRLFNGSRQDSASKASQAGNAGGSASEEPVIS